VKRDEIWEIEFPLPARENAEPYGHGLVVIVSSDAYNRSAIQTVLVAVVTTNLKLARAPGNVLVLANDTNGLHQDSVVNVSQILVVDKSRLLTQRGALNDTEHELLEYGLRNVFGLR
jgi:mRNA interferase MazF